MRQYKTIYRAADGVEDGHDTIVEGEDALAERLNLLAAHDATVLRVLVRDVSAWRESTTEPPVPFADTGLVRAVRRACAGTLINWATEDEVRDELAKEEFVGDLPARMDAARQAGLVERGGWGASLRWRAR